MSGRPVIDQSADAAERRAATPEYAAVRSGSGYVDRSDLGVLEVTGKDRATFLHAMLTNDVKSLQPGQGCAAALLDVHGKVQVFTWVWALDDRVLVLTPPGLTATLAETLDTYLFAEKAYLRDASGEMAFLVVAGPATAAMLEKLTGLPLPDRAWHHAPARLAGVDVPVLPRRRHIFFTEPFPELPHQGGSPVPTGFQPCVSASSNRPWDSSVLRW